MITRDSTPVTTVIEPVKAINSVISSYMGIPAESVFINYERWEIPLVGLSLTASYIQPSEEVSNNNYFDPVLDQEVAETVFSHHIVYSIFSIIPDNSARLKKEMPAMALRSGSASRFFTRNRIGMAWIQSQIEDTSMKLETGLYLNRYTASCICYALHTSPIPAGYFGVFPISVTFSDGNSEQIPATNPNPGA